MRIVILDGHTCNPGDVDWSAFDALGTVTVYPRTPADKTVARASGADAVLVNKTVLDAPALERLPGLKYVGVLATGYNNVDVAAARKRGVVVTNVPGYSTASVAQATFALMLELSNSVGVHDAAVHAGKWVESEDFSFVCSSLVELDGLTLGLVGYGAIGKAVGRIARAMGMKLAVHTRTRPEEEDIEWMELDDLFTRADVISLHCPLTDATARMVDARRLSLMKPTAFLINTGRGGLVDEQALADALRSGRLAGAGLDVLSTEPPSPGNPLLSAPNCVITPHIAWATRAARKRLVREAAENMAAFVNGRKRNVVS